MLSRLGATKLSNLLLEQQLGLFGKIARLPNTSPVRNLVFKDFSLDIRDLDIKRRRGRPRLSWISEIARHADLAVQGSDFSYRDFIMDKISWKRMIREYCRVKLSYK